jgi:group I intron endonuclease
MIIYLATNMINGKVYVGQTTETLEQRWSRHVRAAKRKDYYFPRAIQKYGPASFTIVPIWVAESKAELDVMEKRFIAALDARNPAKGYNVCIGGEGVTMTPEVRAKIGAANHFTRLGKHMSEETKARQSVSIIKAFERPEVKANHRAAMLGHPTPQATRDKIAAAQQGIPKVGNYKAGRAKQVMTPEHRAAIGEGGKRAYAAGRRTVTQEQKNRVAAMASLAAKARWSKEARVS